MRGSGQMRQLDKTLDIWDIQWANNTWVYGNSSDMSWCQRDPQKVKCASQKD